MALKQTNVTVDIFRGFSVTRPYPMQGQTPAVSGVRGFLKHHLNAGRFGYQDPKVKWTHLLLLDPEVDVRSAYNSWTGGAEVTANADTILLRDCPIPGNCCAYYVVMVQRGGRGSGGDHLRVYSIVCSRAAAAASSRACRSPAAPARSSRPPGV
jgi:hypothetical protein